MDSYTATRNSLKPFYKNKQNAVPKSYEEIANRILLYESFKNGLTSLETMFNSELPNSVIITGYTVSGKLTMVKMAEFNTGTKTVYLNSDMFTTDVAALHHLLNELKMNRRDTTRMQKETLSDTINAIKKSQKVFPVRFAVVLCDFDGFCRKSQKLLYNLTELLQAGINMTLVAITSSRDCTENWEKRVSSRMSASTFSLDVPYKTGDEYISFAKQLLGNIKITEDIEKILLKEFNTNDRSLPSLKRILISMCTFDDQKLHLNTSMNGDIYKPRERNVGLIEHQIKWLPDLYVLTRIVAYCKRNIDQTTNCFRVNDVINWHRTCQDPVNLKRFNLAAIRTLLKANIITRLRESERIGHETDFVLLITYKFYKILVEKDKSSYGDILEDRIYTLR